MAERTFGGLEVFGTQYARFDRRILLRRCLAGGVGLAAGHWARRCSADSYDVDLRVVTSRYDGRTCWCHPRAGMVPGAGEQGQPRVVMTMNTLDVRGSDVFKEMASLYTNDMGKTWSEPKGQQGLAVRYEEIDGVRCPVALSDTWPMWHAATKTLLGTGHTVVYTPDWKIAARRSRHTAYATYDVANDRWNRWRRLVMPGGSKFAAAGAGCVQRFDCDDGTILLPFYFQPPNKNSHVAVMRCRFDGRTLEYVEHGNELSVADRTRGLHEPSLVRFSGQYLLTIRNDKRGYVTRSRDGLNYEPIREWRFDDGSELGNYNTQQHWVSHRQRLFLVYTRRGANNDHVFRHRAPLFMAEVDTDKLVVRKESERVLVPERGARLGNFGVTRISDRESWVTVAEWMQTWGPNYVMPVENKYGSNGSVFVARIV